MTMTAPARRTLNAIIEDARKNPKSIMLIAFGSQIYGKPRLDSDLDILYIVDDYWISHHKRLELLVQNTKGGVKNISNITRSVDDILISCNKYETGMYDAVRYGQVVFARQPATDRLFSQLRHFDAFQQARWEFTNVKHTLKFIKQKSNQERRNKDHRHFEHSLYYVVLHLLHVLLLMNNIFYPMKANIETLYNMLPCHKKHKNSILYIESLYEKSTEGRWCVPNGLEETDIKFIFKVIQNLYNTVNLTTKHGQNTIYV